MRRACPSTVRLSVVVATKVPLSINTCRYIWRHAMPNGPFPSADFEDRFQKTESVLVQALVKCNLLSFRYIQSLETDSVTATSSTVRSRSSSRFTISWISARIAGRTISNRATSIAPACSSFVLDIWSPFRWVLQRQSTANAFESTSGNKNRNGSGKLLYVGQSY